MGDRRLVMPWLAGHPGLWRPYRPRNLHRSRRLKKVAIVNRIEKVNAAFQSLPVGVWTVTQTPPKQIFARLVPAAKAPGYAPCANRLLSCWVLA